MVGFDCQRSCTAKELVAELLRIPALVLRHPEGVPSRSLVINDTSTHFDPMWVNSRVCDVPLAVPFLLLAGQVGMPHTAPQRPLQRLFMSSLDLGKPGANRPLAVPLRGCVAIHAR